MREGIGQQWFEQRGIKHEDAARDRGHAADHGHEQLAACQVRQERPHHHWALDHAHERIGRRRHADHTVQTHRAAERPAKDLDDASDDAQMKEQGRQRRNQQHHGQCLRGQHKQRLGLRHGVGRGAAAQMTKDH